MSAPLSNATRLWMAEASALASRFATRLSDPSTEARQLDAAIVHVAAAHVGHVHPKPEWCALDVSSLLRAIAELPGCHRASLAVAATLSAFYQFLVEDGVLTPEQAEPVAAALAPHLRVVMGQLKEVPDA
jgi:hypothetical protein